MPEEVRKRISGFWSTNLGMQPPLQSGIDMTQPTGIGVVPYADIDIDSEDM